MNWLLCVFLLFAGCADKHDHTILIGAQPDYDVGYSLQTATGGLALCFTEVGIASAQLLAVGRVECPWNSIQTLLSGDTARLRVWGHDGVESIEMEIRINGILVVSDVLSNGDSLKELEFELP